MMSLAHAVPGLARSRARAEGLAASPRARRIAAVAALVAFGAVWGAAVSVAGVNALLIGLSLIACIFCLRDFRAGVVLLVVIMPVSSSNIFPHEMFGVSGLNPLNLLLATTLVSYLMGALGSGAFRGLLPRPLVWLYIVPIVAGGLLGMSHVGLIPPIFKSMDWIEYDAPGGYLRDLVVKPLFLVLYAMLVGAAVAKSEKPEAFLKPLWFSMWVMGAMVVIYIVASGASLAQLAGIYARSFLSALGMHANDLGRLYATAYALTLFVWDRTERPALKTLLMLTMGVVFVALMLTFSRGAFTGFVIVNVVYLFSRRKLKTLALAAMVVPVAIALAPGAFVARLEMGSGQGLDAISAGRVGEIWAPLLPEIITRAPWGDGLQSILWTHAMRSGRMLEVTHPHSAYLQLYLDIGAIGLVLVMAFWIGHVWKGFRKLAREPRLTPELAGFFEGAAAGLFALFIANVAGSSFFPVPEQSFLWLAIGVMYGVRLRLAAAAPQA